MLKEGKLSDGRDCVRGVTSQTLIVSNCRSDGSKRRNARLLGWEPILCVVTNGAGSTKTNPAAFTVNQSPREVAAILRHDYDVAVKLADRYGLPPPPKIGLPHLSSSKPTQKDMDTVNAELDKLNGWTREHRDTLAAAAAGSPPAVKVKSPSKASVNGGETKYSCPGYDLETWGDPEVDEPLDRNVQTPAGLERWDGVVSSAGDSGAYASSGSSQCTKSAGRSERERI